MMANAALERAILAELHDASGNMVAEPTLWRDVSGKSPLPIKRDELHAVLIDLAERNQVFGVKGEDYTKWKISPLGSARLQELNIAPRPDFKPTRRTRRAVDEQ